MVFGEVPSGERKGHHGGETGTTGITASAGVLLEPLNLFYFIQGSHETGASALTSHLERVDSVSGGGL